MFRRRLTSNQDVVQVDKKEIKPRQCGVHETLESLGRVFESERHPDKLKKTKRRDHCRFLDVVWMNWNLVVATDEVHFRENGLACQICSEVMDSRNRIAVILVGFIEPSKISARSITSPRFGNDVERGRIRAV